MERLILVLIVAILGVHTPALAQLEAANEAGVSFGGWPGDRAGCGGDQKVLDHSGRKTITIDGADVMKFPGFLIFLAKGSPSAGSYGSVINHVTFLVPHHREAIPAWKAAGATAIFGVTAYGRNSQGYAFTPDDLKIRINDDQSVITP